MININDFRIEQAVSICNVIKHIVQIKTVPQEKSSTTLSADYFRTLVYYNKTNMYIIYGLEKIKFKHFFKFPFTSI